jgi:deoxyribose-phosphate aldolase
VQAAQFGFASVAVLPLWVKHARQCLEGSHTKVTVGVSYPFGASPATLKVAEAKAAIREGAQEIDYVINLPELHNHNRSLLINEAKQMRKVAGDRVLKAIIELWSLNEEEVVMCCDVAKEARIDYLKTSTGFSLYPGIRAAKMNEIKRLVDLAGDDIKIKVAGGIRTAEQGLALLKIGVRRLGTSSGSVLVEDFRKISDGIHSPKENPSL